MKIPESIRIGGIEYGIENGVHDLNDGQHLLYGEINYRESKIRISDVCKSHEMRCITLLHEILHGIREHNGMEIENEERIVEMYSKGLYQVLQDNGGRLFDLEGE